MCLLQTADLRIQNTIILMFSYYNNFFFFRQQGKSFTDKRLKIPHF